MAGYLDFKENLAVALGRDEASEAVAGAGDGVGGYSGGADPGGEIEDQADKIAAAVQRYLYDLAAGSTYVKAPIIMDTTVTSTT